MASTKNVHSNQAGEKLPATSETVETHPHIDYQTNVGIHVFEGENEFIAQNKELCYFRLENITRGKKQDVSIGIKFKVDEEGLLTAKANVSISGRSASRVAKISLDGTFTPGEIAMCRQKLNAFLEENDD